MELIWEWSHKETVTVTTTQRQRILVRHVGTHCIHQSNTQYRLCPFLILLSDHLTMFKESTLKLLI